MYFTEFGVWRVMAAVTHGSTAFTAMEIGGERVHCDDDLTEEKWKYVT